MNSEVFFMGGFLVLVAAMLAIDLGLVNKKDHVVSLREALIWTWVLAKEAAVSPEDYTLQLKTFARIAEAEVAKAAAAIETSSWDDIALYRTVLEDTVE